MPRQRRRTVVVLSAAWMCLVGVVAFSGLLTYGTSGQGIPTLRRSSASLNADPSRWARGIRVGFARTQVVATFQTAEPSSSDVDPGWLRTHGVSWHPIPWSYSTTHPYPKNISVQTIVQEDMFGWPMRMCGWRSVSSPPLDPAGQVVVSTNGGVSTTVYTPVDALPILWWPGILFNLFLGPALILASAPARRAFLGWKENSRRLQGLCVACGHSRSGIPADAPCPECGTKPGVSRTN